MEEEWGAESGVWMEHCLGCYPVDSWFHRRRRVGGASWWTRRKVDGGGGMKDVSSTKSPVSSTKPIMEFLFTNVVVSEPAHYTDEILFSMCINHYLINLHTFDQKENQFSYIKNY